MSIQPRPRRPLAAPRQRGQAMLLMVLLLGVGAAGVVYTFVTPAIHSIERDKITAAALAQARDALIGRAAADQTRPGSLSCPDTGDDGEAESPVAFGGVCPSYVGRMPWKTLGLPDLRDGSGERLWYALTPAFRDHPTGGVLNSDTPGQLTITGTAAASNVIAIIFAPGTVIGTQNRNNLVISLCSTTGTNLQNNLCAANYLDGENANGSPPADVTFTTALPSQTFNDQLLPITSDALFNVVNVRVAKEAIAALESYRSGLPGPPAVPGNGYYPFANDYGSAAPYFCNSALPRLRGRFPITTVGGTCGQAAWPPGALPAWFATNNWNLVTHYAMSKACGQLGLPLGLDALVGGLLCGLATSIGAVKALVDPILALLGLPPLTDEPINVTGVTGANGARTLVVVTGRAVGAQVHPCAAVGGCLEDAANADGNANYVKPSRFPASNDRMAICDNTGPCPIVP